MTEHAGAQRVVTATPAGATVEFKVHFRRGGKGRRRLRQGGIPTSKAVEPGHIPRISRLMALAIRFDALLRQGAVRDYADLARLGNISRSRVSQVMDLLNLAPEIQEELLFLPRTIEGRDPVTERQLRGIVAEVDWSRQMEVWEARSRSSTPRTPGRSRNAHHALR